MVEVYRYIDVSDETVKYIGIVYSAYSTVLKRVYQHHNDAWFIGIVWRVERLCLNLDNLSRTDVECIEGHFISRFGTDKWYNRKKAGWGESALYNEVLKHNVFEEHWEVVEDNSISGTSINGRNLCMSEKDASFKSINDDIASFQGQKNVFSSLVAEYMNGQPFKKYLIAKGIIDEDDETTKKCLFTPLSCDTPSLRADIHGKYLYVFSWKGCKGCYILDSEDKERFVTYNYYTVSTRFLKYTDECIDSFYNHINGWISRHENYLSELRLKYEGPEEDEF